MFYDLSLEEEREKFKSKVDDYTKKGLVVELKKVHKKRTLSQNSFIHVLFTLYGIEFGYTMEEAKTHLKRSCPFMRYEKNGEWFLKKTSAMSTEELSEFIEWIYNYTSGNGCYLPSSESYSNNIAYYSNIIESNKEYL